MSDDRKKSRISTIIFDIGNVLINWDYYPYLQALLKDETVVERVDRAIWKTGLWDELDRGEDKEEILARMIAEDPECGEAIIRAVENIGQCMGRKDYAIPWIQELKQRGYQVLYLSNYSTHVMAAKPEVLDFLPYMDGGVFSCHVRLLKPDPAIYQTILEKYSLDPAACVFLDDNAANVKGAKDAGIEAIRFQNYEQGREELERILENGKE